MDGGQPASPWPDVDSAGRLRNGFGVLRQFAECLGADLVVLIHGASGAAKMNIKSALVFLLIAAPYLTFGIAQTSRLHDAVRTGNLDNIKSALKPWKSPNGHNENRSTPLQIAIMDDRVDVVEFLISKGAQVYLRSAAGSNVDHVLYAVRLQRREITEILLKAGGPPPNSNALFEAIRIANLELVALLLKYRSPVKAASHNSPTALQEVLSIPKTTPIERRIAIADLLLAHGARLSSSEEINTDFNSLLHQVFWQAKPDLEMADYLLNRGFPINAVNSDRYTALRIAVNTKSVEGVRFLLDRKADPNISVPIAAIFSIYSQTNEKQDKQISILELLIKYGANVNNTDRLGNSALISAITAKSYVGVKLLLDAGARLNIDQKYREHLENSTTEEIKALLLNTTVAGVPPQRGLNQKKKPNSKPRPD